ncbi:aminotransferase class I/II-fold pyridoxal phosphate-dependent enzyme [Micromonospora sp. CPCC 206061]|uniref:aminotransferase class I/II-fold pyridoxal phosphate-dependent enzyme n=1 Tax=Micromonospora sp. CPCC 206061 TaxID=3122410 RepID=UPI002FF1E40D
MTADTSMPVPRPSPAALAAYHEAANVDAAPDPDSAGLRHALAAHYAIPDAGVRVGPGTAALLHSTIARQAPAGGEVICSAPSWPPYAHLTAAYGMRPRLVPLAGYAHDLAAITAAITAHTRLILLDSPHCVTGATVPLHEARTLARALPDGAALVYDNVYGEYQDDDLTAAIRDTVTSGARILVCRTFSKAHHLFGLRVGYLLAHPHVMHSHGPTILRYDVSRPGQAAALASLNDPAHLDRNRSLVQANRRQAGELLARAGIAHSPGQGHGVLFAPADPAGVTARLRAAGATVRTPDEHGVHGHLHLRVDDLPTDDLLNTLTSSLEST